MIGLAVYLNGKKLTVAGAEDLGVLNAIVTAGGELGKSTALFRKRRSVHVHLSVGGLTHRGDGVENEHLRWVGLRPLRVGDRISVRIVRTDRPSRHTNASPAAAHRREINERRLKLREAQKARSSRSQRRA
jgi:hypothetical protein